ncbi:hypothetical protein [Nonomuraea basaltis]|uniref:hypothetical protein n=1 Tax=Nonomuraea basaltis TaxID=2495887 RepID=UPI00110C64B2|nr:hypothetical protein [Nonomuraea basaltis]TMR89105.1 hypothetical protein EJK15_62575 [Nonomuraea basaltis]
MNTVERIDTDHAVTKRLGNWTTADRFEVRNRHGQTTIDLRSPDLPAELEVQLDLEHGVIKLLIPEDATLDQSDLRWTGRAKVKDHQAPEQGSARRIRLTGTATKSEVRVHRGGVAIIAAMMSHEYVDDVRQSHKNGTVPTVDDPARRAAGAP